MVHHRRKGGNMQFGPGKESLMKTGYYQTEPVRKEPCGCITQS